MDFLEPQHRNIAAVLQALNPQFFWDSGAAFGGGTLLSLQNGEYRVSYDIDFIADRESFHRVRQAMPTDRIDPLFLKPTSADAHVIKNRDKVLFTLNRIKFEKESGAAANTEKEQLLRPVPCSDDNFILRVLGEGIEPNVPWR